MSKSPKEHARCPFMANSQVEPWSCSSCFISGLHSFLHFETNTYTEYNYGFLHKKTYTYHYYVYYKYIYIIYIYKLKIIYYMFHVKELRNSSTRIESPLLLPQNPFCFFQKTQCPGWLSWSWTSVKSWRRRKCQIWNVGGPNIRGDDWGTNDTL